MLVVVVSRRPILQRIVQIVLSEYLAMQEFCVFESVGQAASYVLREGKPVICALLDWTINTRHNFKHTKRLWSVCRGNNPRFYIYYLVNVKTKNAMSLWHSWYRLVHVHEGNLPNQPAVIDTNNPNWPVHLAQHVCADKNQASINRLFRATTFV